MSQWKSSVTIPSEHDRRESWELKTKGRDQKVHSYSGFLDRRKLTPQAFGLLPQAEEITFLKQPSHVCFLPAHWCAAQCQFC